MVNRDVEPQSQFSIEGSFFCLSSNGSFRKLMLFFGTPFIILGFLLLALYVYDSIDPYEQSSIGALITGSLFFFFGLLLPTIEFSRYLSFDGRILITRHRHFFIRWEERQPLSEFTAIKLDTYCHDRVSSYRVSLKTNYFDTLLYSDVNYIDARSHAEQLVRHFKVPLEDSTDGETVVTQAEEIDSSIGGSGGAMPNAPAASRIRVRRLGDQLLILFPSATRIPASAVLRFSILVVVGGFFIAKAMTISEDVRAYFISFFTLIMILNFLRDYLPFYFKPWVKLSSSGIWCKPHLFKRKMLLNLSDLEEIRITDTGNLVVRSDKLYLRLPISSHQEDREFTKSLFVWLAHQTSHRDDTTSD